MNNRTIKFAVAAALIGSTAFFTGIEAKAAEIRITLPGISLCFGSDDRPCPPPRPHHKPVVVVKPCPPPEPVVVVKPCPPPRRPVVVVPAKPVIEIKADCKDHHSVHKRPDRHDRPHHKPHGHDHGHRR